VAVLFHLRRLAVCLVCALLPVRAADGVSAGPLRHDFSLTLDLGERTEIAGPFWSTQKEGTKVTMTLAPLFSRVDNPDVEAVSIDVLYPLMSYDAYGPEYRWHLFQLLSISGGKNQSGGNVKRTTVFPFYFSQTSPNPSEEYTAFLPFYGTVKNRLFRDEVHFVLFPGYVQTRKRDVVTDNYLAPIFHLRHGNGLEGWQFWPLIGREHKEITTVTNGFGDTELVGGHDKSFVLWPIYLHNEIGIGTTNAASQLAVLPFYSIQRSPTRTSTSYFWPLGVTVTDDREAKFHEVGAPWPLILFTRGEGKTVNRVWPLFGRAHNTNLVSDFYLWPIYKYNRVQAEPLDRERMRILFFLYSDLTEKNTLTGNARRRTDLWPLFTARRDGDGNERLQLLAPIELILPNNPSVERNWSPLWSIWRSEKNARTGAQSESFLWNLYRRERTPETKKCSLLFGLIQYQSGPKGAHWRWFYLPRGKSGASEAHRDASVK